MQHRESQTHQPKFYRKEIVLLKELERKLDLLQFEINALNTIRSEQIIKHSIKALELENFNPSLVWNQDHHAIIYASALRDNL